MPSVQAEIAVKVKKYLFELKNDMPCRAALAHSKRQQEISQSQEETAIFNVESAKEKFTFHH